MTDPATATADVARRFASKDVQVVTVPNRGASNARNHAFRLSQGDYIQWLDADDLLAPDKIEKQLSVPGVLENRKILLSSAWAYFNYRTSKARFVPTRFYQDLAPVEWLFRKLSENLHMQTGTWLTSRELLQAAGPWDTRLMSDDDGEYYCRVLLASAGTKFVPEAKVFYRVTSSSRWSHIGTSNKKKDAMLLSMKLHIQYIRSLEDSDRVRQGLPDLHAKLAGQLLPGAPGYCAGAASDCRGIAWPPRCSSFAPEIRMDRADLRPECCQARTNDSSAVEGFTASVVG